MFAILMDLIKLWSRVVISRFLDLRGNLGSSFLLSEYTSLALKFYKVLQLADDTNLLCLI